MCVTKDLCTISRISVHGWLQNSKTFHRYFIKGQFGFKLEVNLNFQMQNIKVLWIDMHGGNTAASDASGNVALINCEGTDYLLNNRYKNSSPIPHKSISLHITGETIWKKKSKGHTI